MKKGLGTICLLASIMVGATSALAGCGTYGPGGDEEIDTTRTQLYVYNYDGGYGSEWMSKVKARYEALHAEDVYEEGKKGIQIMVNNTKQKPVDEAIKTNTDEVYFTEGIYYYSLINQGILGDITAAVTGENPYEKSKTIESKYSTQQKAFYNVNEATGGTAKYYGIPHYSGYYGIVYDIDLFEKRGYYFLETPTGSTLEDKFDYDRLGKAYWSAGPDGVKGTDDDGLPATYDEFFELCEYISGSGDTPVSWSGQYYGRYLTNLATSLITDFEGLDQMMLRYTFDGEATDLGHVQGGTFVKDANPTTITSENGYELSRQEGAYHALSFIDRLIKVANGYPSTTSVFKTTHSHIDGQDDFLHSENDGKPIAMHIDGVWWESEATNTFNKMAQSNGEEFSKENRNFGWLPFPNATASKQKAKNTLFDQLYSLCFMKSTIAEWKIPIAIDFIQFANTDETLVEFTQTTNTSKALNYTMTDEQMAKMTTFGRSAMKLRQNSDVVYPYSTNTFFLNNQSKLAAPDNLWSSISGIGDRQFPSTTFKERSVTVEQYFNGIYEYYSTKLWHKN